MLKDWIRQARERGASDLHLEAGTPVVLRVRGELASLGSAIPGEPLLEQARELLSPGQWQEFLTRRSYDLSKTVQGVRCRSTCTRPCAGWDMSVRLLSSSRTACATATLHPDLARFVQPRSGP